jgi:hypothetical protein
MAKLVDVFPDGYAHMVQEGVLRTSSMPSDEAGHHLKSGTILELDIDLVATSYVVKAGHKVRVEISGSDFNRYDRNQNVSGAYGQEVRCDKATQTVFHDSERPSSIVLPIVPK